MQDPTLSEMVRAALENTNDTDLGHKVADQLEKMQKHKKAVEVRNRTNIWIKRKDHPDEHTRMRALQRYVTALMNCDGHTKTLVFMPDELRRYSM